MGRNQKIKLSIKSEKQLKQLIKCADCGKLEEYGKLYFYVDDSNIAITNNSKGICKTCKDDTRRKNNLR
jgi:hypothetical protein